MNEQREIPMMDVSEFPDDMTRGPDGFAQSLAGVIVSDYSTFNAVKALTFALVESEDLRDAWAKEAEKHVPYEVNVKDVERWVGVMQAIVQICNMTQDAALEAETGGNA